MLALEILFIACVLFAGLSIVLTTMKTGISPVPSTGKARRVMMSATENSGTGEIIDMGSGWGTLVVALARKYPDRHIIGYELSWVPWAFSMIRKSIFRLNNLTLYHKNIIDADLSCASVVVCYLFRGSMLLLQDKLEHEPHGEIRVVSSTFALTSFQPTDVIRLNDMYRSPIYVYQCSAVIPPNRE